MAIHKVEQKKESLKLRFDFSSLSSNTQTARVSSDQSNINFLTTYAKNYYKLNAMDEIELNITTPLNLLEVGDTIEVYSSGYNIPHTVGANKFIITSITHKIDNIKALSVITAKRWDYGAS